MAMVHGHLQGVFECQKKRKTRNESKRRWLKEKSHAAKNDRKKIVQNEVLNLEERTCEGGCGKTFKVLPQSPHRFARSDCQHYCKGEPMNRDIKRRKAFSPLYGNKKQSLSREFEAEAREVSNDA